MGMHPAGTLHMLEDVDEREKGKGGGQEKSKEERLTERLLSYLRQMAFSLSNFTKDHRLLTARDIKQFCSPNTAPPSLV